MVDDVPDYNTNEFTHSDSHTGTISKRPPTQNYFTSYKHLPLCTENELRTTTADDKRWIASRVRLIGIAELAETGKETIKGVWTFPMSSCSVREKLVKQVILLYAVSVIVGLLSGFAIIPATGFSNGSQIDRGGGFLQTEVAKIGNTLLVAEAVKVHKRPRGGRRLRKDRKGRKKGSDDELSDDLPTSVRSDDELSDDSSMSVRSEDDLSDDLSTSVGSTNFAEVGTGKITCSQICCGAARQYLDHIIGAGVGALISLPVTIPLATTHIIGGSAIGWSALGSGIFGGLLGKNLLQFGVISWCCTPMCGPSCCEEDCWKKRSWRCCIKKSCCCSCCFCCRQRWFWASLLIEYFHCRFYYGSHYSPVNAFRYMKRIWRYFLYPDTEIRRRFNEKRNINGEEVMSTSVTAIDFNNRGEGFGTQTPAFLLEDFIETTFPDHMVNKRFNTVLKQVRKGGDFDPLTAYNTADRVYNVSDVHHIISGSDDISGGFTQKGDYYTVDSDSHNNTSTAPYYYTHLNGGILPSSVIKTIKELTSETSHKGTNASYTMSLGESAFVSVLSVGANSRGNFESKLTLIRNAQRSVEVSFNFGGGEPFEEILGMLKNKMRKIPEFQVSLLVSDNLFIMKNDDFIELIQMASDFRRQFHVCITTEMSQWNGNVLWPARDKEDNYIFNTHNEELHVKILIVDGKFAQIGSSGVDPTMVSEKERTDFLRSHVQGLVAGQVGLKEGDIVLGVSRREQYYGSGKERSSPLAFIALLRRQFFQLFCQWRARMWYTMRGGGGGSEEGIGDKFDRRILKDLYGNVNIPEYLKSHFRLDQVEVVFHKEANISSGLRYESPDKMYPESLFAVCSNRIDHAVDSSSRLNIGVHSQEYLEKFARKMMSHQAANSAVNTTATSSNISTTTAAPTEADIDAERQPIMTIDELHTEMLKDNTYFNKGTHDGLPGVVKFHKPIEAQLWVSDPAHKGRNAITKQYRDSMVGLLDSWTTGVTSDVDQQPFDLAKVPHAYISNLLFNPGMESTKHLISAEKLAPTDSTGPKYVAERLPSEWQTYSIFEKGLHGVSDTNISNALANRYNEKSQMWWKTMDVCENGTFLVANNCTGEELQKKAAQVSYGGVSKCDAGNRTRKHGFGARIAPFQVMTNTDDTLNIVDHSIAYEGRNFKEEFGGNKKSEFRFRDVNFAGQWKRSGIMYHRKQMVVKHNNRKDGNKDHVLMGSYNMGMKSGLFDNELLLVLHGEEIAEKFLQLWINDVEMAQADYVQRGKAKGVAANVFRKKTKGFFDPQQVGS